MKRAPWIETHDAAGCEAFTWVDTGDTPALVLRHAHGHIRVSPVEFEWFSALRKAFMDGELERGRRLLSAATSRWGPVDEVTEIFQDASYNDGVRVTAQRLLFAADTQDLLNNTGYATRAIVGGSCALADYRSSNCSLSEACDNADETFSLASGTAREAVSQIREHGLDEELSETIVALDDEAEIQSLPTVTVDEA